MNENLSKKPLYLIYVKVCVRTHFVFLMVYRVFDGGFMSMDRLVFLSCHSGLRKRENVWLCFFLYMVMFPICLIFLSKNSAEMLIFRAFCGFNESFGNILAFFLLKSLSVKV